jgi:hypothetical protein
VSRRMSRRWCSPTATSTMWDSPCAPTRNGACPERNRFLYPFTRPRSLPVLAGMAAAGALKVKGVSETQVLTPGTAVPVPGRPTVVHTPGHTDGHCILHLPDRGTVLSGGCTGDPRPVHRNVRPANRRFRSDKQHPAVPCFVGCNSSYRRCPGPARSRSSLGARRGRSSTPSHANRSALKPDHYSATAETCRLGGSLTESRLLVVDYL